jgi:hypothetical protein
MGLRRGGGGKTRKFIYLSNIQIWRYSATLTNLKHVLSVIEIQPAILGTEHADGWTD